MRKFLVSTAITLMMALFFVIPIYASNIRLDVHGEELTFEGQNPVIVDNRTLVPVRGVFEALGFDVGWDGEAQRVTLARGPNTITIYIGQDNFWLNGANFELDVSAQIINGSTMLPHGKRMKKF